jgi:hypothetical protein
VQSALLETLRWDGSLVSPPASSPSSSSVPRHFKRKRVLEREKRVEPIAEGNDRLGISVKLRQNKEASARGQGHAIVRGDKAHRKCESLVFSRFTALFIEAGT